MSDLARQAQETNPVLIRELLASPRKGDLFRALYLLERTIPRKAGDVQPLLSHEDPEIRARAITVFTADRTDVLTVIPLLKDPEARVRITAAHAIQGSPGWSDRIRTLAADPDRDVKLAVHRILCDSPESDVAQASFLELIRARIWDAAHLSASRLGTPASAKEFLEWMEGVLKKGWNEDLGMFDMDDILGFFPAESLRPLTPRIVALYRGEEKVEDLRKDLARTLAKIPDPRAEEVVTEILSPLSGVTWEMRHSILYALLQRESKIESGEEIRALELIATKATIPDDFDYGADASLAAAMVLLRSGLPGWEKRIHEKVEEEGISLLDDPDLWIKAPASLLDSVESISEFHRQKIQQIRGDRAVEPRTAIQAAEDEGEE